MELMELLEAYSKAQKLSGMHFIILGGSLLVFALTIQLLSKNNDLSQGFKIGALVCGFLFSLMGYSYRNYVEKLHQETISINKTSSEKAINTEHKRIVKTVKEFPMYQYIFAGIIILGLAIVLIIDSEYWKGIAYSTILTFVFAMMIETASSHPSMKIYLNGMNKIMVVR